MGLSYSGTIEDDYALNWVALPLPGQPYNIGLRNTSPGGELRASVVCDTGTILDIHPFPAALEAGESDMLDFDPTGCASAVLVITNQARTPNTNNPDSSTPRSYTVSLTSVTFVVDDTGSMSDEIEMVKTSVSQKVDEFSASGLFPNYRLITYKDAPSDLGATSNPDTFKSWVNALYADLGGDCPEDMLGALNLTAQLSPNSEAFVMTDAGFHGTSLDFDNTMLLLNAAGVRVNIVKYGYCSGSSSSSSFMAGGQDDNTKDNGIQEGVSAGVNTLTSAEPNAFAKRLAAETGGHYFQIDSSETPAAVNILMGEYPYE